MRVVHVVEATFAGVGRHVLDLVRSQVAGGHDVQVVFSPTRASPSFEQERCVLHDASWHPHSMPRAPHPRDVAAIARVRRLSRDADVVHGHSTKGGLVARAAALRSPARVVYTPNAVYSMNPTLPMSLRRGVGILERTLATATDRIIAVSPEEAQHLGSLGIDSSKVRVILNGTAAVAVADRDDVRRRLQLPSAAPIVGFVGRLDDQKAPTDLLDIFEIAVEDSPSLHLAIVGDGPLRPTLERRVHESRTLAGRVSILGERPGTWAMAAFDVLALPSRYEGFPYVLLEAAAQGLVFVASDRCNASELVRRGAAGDIVDRSDVDGFARVLARRANEARRHEPVLIDRDTMAAEVMDVYRELALPTKRH